MDDETRLAFYEAFKKNPDDALQTFEKNSEKVDEWVRTGKVDGVVSFGKYATKIDEAVIVLEKESLFGDLASTFLDSEYRTVKSTKQVTTYRSFGLKAE